MERLLSEITGSEIVLTVGLLTISCLYLWTLAKVERWKVYAAALHNHIISVEGKNSQLYNMYMSLNDYALGIAKKWDECEKENKRLIQHRQEVERAEEGLGAGAKEPVGEAAGA